MENSVIPVRKEGRIIESILMIQDNKMSEIAEIAKYDFEVLG